MGRSDRYRRTTGRQNWSEADMEQAIKAINDKKMGWLAASKRFNIPKTTLRRRCEDKNKCIKGSSKGLGHWSVTFSPEMERELVNFLKDMEVRFYGITTKELRRLAYEFAERNKLNHRFNRQEKLAGWDWLYCFRERHPDISLRQPEATSAARASGFNRVQVQKFFKILSDTVKKYNIPPERMFNMDESALSTVQRPSKVFATKGRKQVGALTSAERGIHTTVVCCMNPLGHFIPPALIFARKNAKPELTDAAPTGTLQLCQESGWMTGVLFLKWLTHFIKYTDASNEKKVLLLLDGHSSHKYLEALETAKANGVIILCTPPHCTHRIQPLDVAFFGPLSTYYNQSISIWLKNNPGRTVSVYQVGTLFREAYEKAAVMKNAVSGFSNTGIFPFNPEIFPD